MLRTRTTHLSSLTRSGSVTYAFHSAPRTTITIPAHSTWTSGLHWHEAHVEDLHVIRGRALVTVENSTRIYTADDGVIEIPRYARHEWRRADLSAEGELVVEEWTDPADGGKELFFRNLNGVVTDEMKGREKPREWLLEWKLWVVFYGLDNYPVVLGSTWYVQWVLTHALLFLAVVIGWPVGFRSLYDEYTPVQVRREKAR